MRYGVGHRHGSDPRLLWLWHWPVAIAPIRPLAWELPYAIGVALKKKKKSTLYILVLLEISYAGEKLWYSENYDAA